MSMRAGRLWSAGDSHTTMLDGVRKRAAAAVTSIRCATSATVTIISPTGNVWAVHTEPEAAVLLDTEQCHDGPTLRTIRTDEITRIGNTSAEHTTVGVSLWPEYRAACGVRGVGSVAAFPIAVGCDTVGALTIVSHETHGFDAAEIQLGRQAAQNLVWLLKLRTSAA